MSAAETPGLRRSALYRLHRGRGAQLASDGSVLSYATAEGNDEAALARHLGLIDLSLRQRTGFKGPNTPQWLRTQGLTLPEAPNRANRQRDGVLIARLSAEEHLLLANLLADSPALVKLDDLCSLDATPGTYRLPRADSHCWFALTGQHAASALAKQCQVDLRAKHFANHAVAQTSLARVNAIIIRDDIGANLNYQLLSDASSAEYLWRCLLDAMQEFGGGPIGLSALRALEQA